MSYPLSSFSSGSFQCPKASSLDLSRDLSEDKDESTDHNNSQQQKIHSEVENVLRELLLNKNLHEVKLWWASSISSVDVLSTRDQKSIQPAYVIKSLSVTSFE